MEKKYFGFESESSKSESSDSPGSEFSESTKSSKSSESPDSKSLFHIFISDVQYIHRRKERYKYHDMLMSLLNMFVYTIRFAFFPPQNK